MFRNRERSDGYADASKGRRHRQLHRGADFFWPLHASVVLMDMPSVRIMSAGGKLAENTELSLAIAHRTSPVLAH
jgi:hypothetical protein